MKVYFISGLAADRSVFKHIRLPAFCQPVYLDWIEPQKNESLSHYALRLAEKIDPSEAFALIGLSMGGMLVVEISGHVKPSHIILISSISSSKQLPVYYRFLGALQLHRFLPISIVQKAAVLKRLFTAETPEDKNMLKAMIRKSDVRFIRWAMGAILGWKHPGPARSFYHIHGTHDEVLPRRFTRPTHILPKAGHLMVMNRATEINRLLTVFLSEKGNE